MLSRHVWNKDDCIGTISTLLPKKFLAALQTMFMKARRRDCRRQWRRQHPEFNPELI
jgi:hypothetical protein